MSMNNQGAFDAALLHLLNQGHRSVNSSGRSQLRALRGGKNAIGALIPDQLYSKTMEGKTVQQLLAALAFAVLIGGPTIDGKVAGDLGGLLMTTLLGVVYLELMTFVVAWYGDLPDKSAWFLKRAESGWIAVLIMAILFGAVFPFSMLLVKAIRDSRRGLRIAGSLILFGTTLHIACLLVPAFDAQAGVIAVACVVLAVLVLASLLIGTGLQRVLEASHAE